MKKSHSNLRGARPVSYCLLLLLASFAFAQDNPRRNFSWTFENNNDPILQIKNRSDDPIEVEIRLIFQDDSYRYPENMEVPTGENRFLRIREAVQRLARKYMDLNEVSSGTVQIQFQGNNDQIETTMVNLNPKMGVTSDTSGGLPAPVIRSISPKSGPPSGGNVITIAGQNFAESTTVKFDGVPALRNLESSEVLIAITPPHASGIVDIEVSNGKRRTLLRRVFTYTAAGPVIVRIDPDFGSPSGGGTIRIVGRNFQPGAKILWDRRAIPTRFVSSEELTVTAPPGPRGSIPLELLNPDGTRVTLEEAYRYEGGPHVIAVQPRMGNPSGGYTATITGENFDPGCSVLFGGNYGQTTYINPRALAAIVPEGESGLVDVSVSTEDGETDTLEAAFIYNQPPVILTVNAYPNPIVRNTTTTITVEADDPEAGNLVYEYRVAQGTGTITGNGRTAIFNSPIITGIAVIQVTVYDQHRAKAQQNLEIQVE